VRAGHARAWPAMGEKNKGQELLIREVRARRDAGDGRREEAETTHGRRSLRREVGC